MIVFFGPSLFKESILAHISPNLQGQLAQISHEPSQAEKPPARAESELSRAELSSDASLYTKIFNCQRCTGQEIPYYLSDF